MQFLIAVEQKKKISLFALNKLNLNVLEDIVIIITEESIT